MAHKQDRLHGTIDAAWRYAEIRCDRSTPQGAAEHIKVQEAYRAGQRFDKRSRIATRPRRRAPTASTPPEAATDKAAP